MTKEEMQQEIEHLQHLLWAAVWSTGGRISIPYSVWAKRSRDVELELYEDVLNESIVVRAVDNA